MDVTWSLGIVSIWSTAEPNLGIVSACLPTMKPLLRRFLPQSKSRSARNSNQRSGSSKRPSATESFGSKGFSRLTNRRGHEQFRELDTDTTSDDHVPVGGPTGTRTHITTSEVGGKDLDIPLNAIEVKTNMDWHHASRDSL
ncbi:MAG: hypothetical protein Q9196_000228 [Gyalolechia fulgens]